MSASKPYDTRGYKSTLRFLHREKRNEWSFQACSCSALADHVNEVKLDADLTTARTRRRNSQQSTCDLHEIKRERLSGVAIKNKNLPVHSESNLPISLHVKNSWNYEALSSEA